MPSRNLLHVRGLYAAPRLKSYSLTRQKSVRQGFPAILPLTAPGCQGAFSMSLGCAAQALILPLILPMRLPMRLP